MASAPVGVADRVGDLLLGADEELRVGQQLIEDHARGKEVGAVVDCPRGIPLGGHVARRPSTVPVCVRSEVSVRAMPKSAILTRPFVMTTRFAGLMSRCDTPALVGVRERIDKLGT